MNKWNRITWIVLLTLIFAIPVITIFLVLLVFVGVLAIVAILSLPIYIHSDSARKVAMQMYEMEQHIIGSLKIARLNTSVLDGWVKKQDLFDLVAEHYSSRNEMILLFLTTLNKLTKENVVLERQLIIEVVINEVGHVIDGPPILYYKHNSDSNYTPRKPKRLPKKKKKEHELHDALPA